MRRALRLIMVCLGFTGLLACTDRGSSVDFASSVDGVTANVSPWRHWQPASGKGLDKADEALLAAASPAAIVLALHGFNDYSNAFQDVAGYLSERGIAVHAYDQRGFGGNPDRGLWPGMAQMTADLERAIVRLRRIYGDTPIYVLGESMGGAVAIVAAADGDPLDVDGLILSAPAVWGGRHMNPFYRVTLWLASTLAPGWQLTGSGLEIRPSDNIEMLRAFSADPLVIKGTRTDAIAGLVALMDRALASAPDLDQPILFLIGENDEIVPPGALEDFESRLETPNVTTIRYPEGYHMLLRDLQRATVFQDIVTWIERSAETAAATPKGKRSGHQG